MPQVALDQQIIQEIKGTPGGEALVKNLVTKIWDFFSDDFQQSFINYWNEDNAEDAAKYADKLGRTIKNSSQHIERKLYEILNQLLSVKSEQLVSGSEKIKIAN